RNLDGSGKLNGPYVNITEAKGSIAQSKTNTFVYQRANEKFEQVMVYYHINQTQEYIHQLGFTDVNNESHDVSVDTYAGDNSFAAAAQDTVQAARRLSGKAAAQTVTDAFKARKILWHTSSCAHPTTVGA